MPTLDDRLNAVVDRAEIDGALLYDIVNGAVDETVTTEGGEVPTLAKKINDLGLNLFRVSMSPVFDGQGAVLTVGAKGRWLVPADMEIDEVTLLADQSGSVAFEVRVCSYAQYDAGSTHPVTGDKISASAPPTISGSYKSRDTTLTGWTTTLSRGDVLEIVVLSCTSITNCSFNILGTRTE